jgi:hypothetical protein
MRLAQHEARVNITWARQNGDLPDPVSWDAADGDIKQWATEAVRAGTIPGIAADPNADFRDFIVERYTAKADVPDHDAAANNRFQLRPKTPFGK